MKPSPGLSQQIRSIAHERYILPALRSGHREFAIPIRSLIEHAKAQGIKTDRKTPQFCTSIQKSEFLQENGLEIVQVEGPPSKLSTTVVVHYRATATDPNLKLTGPLRETPKEKAFRLTEKLSGLLKSELAEYGGAEGFMRWVRSDEEDEKG